ncbi:hypothetical protein JCM30566_18320 [Marinitoga arctica]
MEITIPKDLLMDVLNNIVKSFSSEFLKKIFNLSTKVTFENNSIIIRILLFRYYIKIARVPEQLSGIFEFEHNLPITYIKKDKLPDIIFIDKKKLYLHIPENLITKNLKLEKLEFDRDLIILRLTS